MVLAERIGKKRRFSIGLLLSFVTVLLYSLYWNFRAHDEVYRQFELQKDGRDEGIVWYVLGIGLPPFLLAYWWIMVSNVRYVRERMGLPRRVSQGAFVTMMTIVFALYGTAVLLLLIAANVDSDKVLSAHQRALDLEALAVLAFVASVVFAAVAYARLQRAINELWDAYDARIAQLNAAATVLPPIPPAPPAWPQ